MHETEELVVRLYVLVDDTEAAAQATGAAGGEIAHPPMEIPGFGSFAIYIQGDVNGLDLDEHADVKLPSSRPYPDSLITPNSRRDFPRKTGSQSTGVTKPWIS
jgi:hypothetical protein